MGYQNELLEARQTLRLSGRTASQFVSQLGAIAPILLPPLPGAILGPAVGLGHKRIKPRRSRVRALGLDRLAFTAP